MNKTIYVTACAIRNPAEECALDFVPPMTRRRFSPIQKVVFSLLNDVAPKGSEPKIVFASRDGEVRLTHELVETFNSDSTVSPWKFSSSVYNAAPGLYSVFAGNRSTYTAIAAGDETIEASLVEAVFEGGGCVWCYAEETSGGYGIAAGFSEASGVKDPGRAFRKIEAGAGDVARAPLSFAQVAEFFRGESDRLDGKRISLRAAE